MSMPSHRGNPGSSSAKNSNRNASLIYIYQEMEQRARERKNNSIDNSNSKNKKNNDPISGNKKVSISNITQVETFKKGGSSNNKRRQQEPHRSYQNNYRGSRKKTVNLLPEIDGVRGIGVSDGDATPQELYAIGAVFDHIYRGGSPMNCISVFRKEVNRRPPSKMYGCGGFGFGMTGEDEKSHTGDDDSLPTMDWTFTRSASIGDDTLLDLYTLDGTYDRSFRTRSYLSRSVRSRDSQPWDEDNLEETTGGRFGAPSLPQHRRSGGRKHRSNGTKNGKRGMLPHGQSLIDDEGPLRTVDEEYDEHTVDTDETLERLKTWSEVLAAAAREGATACSGSPSASNARSDLISLVHMLRNTVEENIPEDTRASLARAFDTNLSCFLRSYDRHDAEDYYHESSHMTDEAPERPLNSLARAMKKIAMKEPTRTYAVSEQHQVTGRTSKSADLTIRVASPILADETSTLVSDSVEVTIETSDTPSAAQKMDSSGSTADSSTPSKQTSSNAGPSSTASVGGSSRAETVGSHRGEAASVGTPLRRATSSVPTSIRLPPDTSSEDAAKATVLQELFMSPPRVRSSNSAASRLSLFRRRDAKTVDASTTASVVSSGTGTPSRRHLPPVPPARSPTTPSSASGSAGKLNKSSDTMPSENSIIFEANTEANGTTDNATVVTPPRSVSDVASTKSSPSGISLKKRFSFRRKSTGGSTTGSPRSAMGVDTSTIFQATTDTMSTHMYHAAPANESKDSIENCTTDGVFMEENNHEMLCEEMSL